MPQYLVAVPYTAECCENPHVVLYRVEARDEPEAGKLGLRRARWEEKDAQEYLAIALDMGQLEIELDPVNDYSFAGVECRECREDVTDETVVWLDPYSLDDADPDTGVPYHRDCAADIEQATRRAR